MLIRATALSAHPAAELAPLQVEVGDLVVIGDQSTEWPAFVFVTTGHGSGWIPLRYLSARHGEASVVVPYDTTELPVQKNQVVEVLTRDDASGWWWCRDEFGKEGWVPVSVLTDS